MASDNDESNSAFPNKKLLENDEASESLLPSHSRQRYIMAYNNFEEWKHKNNTTSFSEEVLIAYFEQLSKSYKSSTLYSLYSMMRGIILEKHNINIANYKNLKDVLKKLSLGYKAKKSNSLSPGQVHQFIDTAPDEVYLLTKVALVFGISGGLKRRELCNVRLSDFSDLESALLVKIPEDKSKIPRSFVITGKFYEIYKKYAKLRPLMPGNEQRFFVNYYKGKCTRQYVGINKFGTMVKDIARFLNLPDIDSFTGHSFRASFATGFTDSVSGQINKAGRPKIT